MTFLNPNAALAFSALIFVLLLYILKQKYTDLRLPSTLLWRMALRDTAAATPFRKLKRSLLLALQLLLVAISAFTLMHPILPSSAPSEIMLIFDISGSMQAAASSTADSRLDAARTHAAAFINSLAPHTRVSIVSAGSETRQLLTRSDSAPAALTALNSLASDSSSSSLAEPLSLANALKSEIPTLRTYVYTDQSALPLTIDGAEIVSPFTGADNFAIVSLSARAFESGRQALARLANYGADADLTIEFSADGELIDARRVLCPAGQTADIAFDIPDTAQRVTAQIVEPDALAADNQRELVLRSDSANTGVFTGEPSVFLESALSLRADLRLAHVPLADFNSAAGASLYIFNNSFPTHGGSPALPEAGALLLIAPARACGGISPGTAVTQPAQIALASTPGAAANSAAFESIAANLTLDNVAVREYTPLSGGTPILCAGADVILAVDEAHGQRVAVLGFEIGASNLALTSDFPILLQNLLDYLVPESFVSLDDVNCGDSMPLTLDSRAVSAHISTADGRTIELAPNAGGVVFTDTHAQGVYSLVQTLASGEVVTSDFAVNFPIVESNLAIQEPVTRTAPDDAETSALPDSNAAAANMVHANLPILIALAALLLILLIEWWVSRSVY